MREGKTDRAESEPTDRLKVRDLASRVLILGHSRRVERNIFCERHVASSGLYGSLSIHRSIYPSSQRVKIEPNRFISEEGAAD